LLTSAHAQITPSADAYTNTAAATTNYGAKTLLDVESSQTAYIQFDLSAIPSGYTGANVTKASLKLYVNAVSTAGSFNVDYVNGTWSENTIDASNAPALGTTIVASVPLTTAEKNKYILIDITPAVQAWLNGTANDGIALVGNSPVNASFDSKESTTTSHSPELDVVFAGSGGSGITGIATASGSGLMGGGTSGTLNLSLTSTCATGQVLQWNGTAWVCANPMGTGTITGVTAGTDLTGGGTSGAVTLNLNTANVPLLATANTFTANQTVNGNLTSAGTVSASVINASDASLSGALSINSASNVPIKVTASLPGVTGILSSATATTGEGYGVEGLTDSSGAAYGLVGVARATTGSPYGVHGFSLSPTGFGVVGEYVNQSATGAGLAGNGAGVWGDTGTASGIGVLGSADNGYAGYFRNNTFYAPAVEVQNQYNGGLLFFADGPGGYCDFDGGGNANCTGMFNTVVPVDGGKRKVGTSAIESPQDWFEDAGSASLVNGSAVVVLDPDFIQIVNSEVDYKVFPVPNGDCKGLYVTNKTPTSFEVRELGGGTSSIAFDYRIMALRKNYENVRFADHTNDPGPRKPVDKRGQPGEP
jgi:hypothetical protein